MSDHLSPELRQRIDAEIAAGKFRDEGHLIECALRLMFLRDEFEAALRDRLEERQTSSCLLREV